MSVKVEPISARALSLGEGPHWDERSQALYFVSIPEHAIHKYVPATGAHTKTTVESATSIIIPVEGEADQFVIAQGREYVVVRWEGAEGGAARELRRLGAVDAHAPDNQPNDGKADPRGRLYVGTSKHGIVPSEMEGKTISEIMDLMEREKGALYRLDQRGVAQVWDRISVANGLAFDETAKAMYYIDSFEKKIRRYDYDIETGDISNMRYIFDFEESGVAGFPDGMTIDADGNLWVAAFDASAVIQVSPRGELLRSVSLPVAAVTSCTFGGPHLDQLFVTTGNLGFGKDPEPLAGRTFRITGLGVKGQRNNSFKF